MKAALLVLASCTGPTVVVGDLQEVTVFKAIPNRDLDILFVVDNSPSMTDEQTSLAQNFPLLMDALATLDGGLPNLHIGVTTSDMGTSSSAGGIAPSIGAGPGACDGLGDDGALVQGASVTDRYIIDVAGATTGRIVNYTGMLRDAFASLALVGDLGCGFEQHLRAMRRSLDGNPVNAGFVRPDANLAVVILADEDDCSVGDAQFFQDPSLGPLGSFRCFQFGVECAPDDPTSVGTKTGCVPRATSAYIDDVDPFASFLVNLKGDPRMVMVAGVLAPPAPVEVTLNAFGDPDLAPSCTYSGPSGEQTAFPAVRFQTFFDQFTGRSQLTSICNPDLSGALGQIGMSAKALMGDPCVDSSQLADTSSEPGIQPSCEVVDIRDSAPTVSTQVPFTIEADPTACPMTPDHLRVRLARTTEVFDDTWTYVRCMPR